MYVCMYSFSHLPSLKRSIQHSPPFPVEGLGRERRRKRKKTDSFPASENDQVHETRKKEKGVKGKRKKKGVETVLAVKIEKEEAVKVETDISAGPDYRGSIVPGLFYHSLPSKTDSVSQRHEWWLPVSAALAKRAGDACWDLALRQQGWPSKKRTHGHKAQRYFKKRRGGRENPGPLSFAWEQFANGMARILFVQLSEVKFAQHAQRHPNFLCWAQPFALQLVGHPLLYHVSPLSLGKHEAVKYKLRRNLQSRIWGEIVKSSDLCSIKHGVQLIKNNGLIKRLSLRIQDLHVHPVLYVFSFPSRGQRHFQRNIHCSSLKRAEGS